MKDLLERRKEAEARAAELAAMNELTEELEAEFNSVVEEAERIGLQIKAKEERAAKVADLAGKREEIEERAKRPAGKVVGTTTPRIEGTNREYDNIADFMMAVREASTPGHRTPELLREVQGRMMEKRAGTGLQAQLPSDGGFFLQESHSAELLTKMHDSGQIMSRCREAMLDYGFDSLTMNGIDESSRADGSRAGGVRGYWKAEAAAMTASQPKFHQVKLEPQELTALYYATDKLLRNAPSLAGLVNEEVAKELVFKIEDAIINGTGAGQPLGILQAGCLVSQAVETGQTSADPILAENVSKMYSRLHAPNRAGAVWFINQELEPYLDKLNFSVGTGGQLVYMPAGGLSDAPFARLKGLPVIPVEFCQAPNTAGDIILADMSEYMLCRRGDILSASSIHVQFLYNETVFRFVMEVDGQPLWKEALTPFKATSGVTRSPFVVLAARS